MLRILLTLKTWGLEKSLGDWSRSPGNFLQEALRCRVGWPTLTTKGAVKIASPKVFLGGNQSTLGCVFFWGWQRCFFNEFFMVFFWVKHHVIIYKCNTMICFFLRGAIIFNVWIVYVYLMKIYFLIVQAWVVQDERFEPLRHVVFSEVVCLVGFHTQADPLSLKRTGWILAMSLEPKTTTAKNKAGRFGRETCRGCFHWWRTKVKEPVPN